MVLEFSVSWEIFKVAAALELALAAISSVCVRLFNNSYMCEWFHWNRWVIYWAIAASGGQHVWCSESHLNCLFLNTDGARELTCLRSQTPWSPLSSKISEDWAKTTQKMIFWSSDRNGITIFSSLALHVCRTRWPAEVSVRCEEFPYRDSIGAHEEVVNFWPSFNNTLIYAGGIPPL